MSGRILLATDGSPQTLGAVRVAKALAERDGREVQVLTVHEPAAVLATTYASAVPLVYPGPDGTQAEDLRACVERSVRAVGGVAAEWPVQVELGSPARTVARSAGEHGFDLIVLGLGRHDAVERWIGRETALDVVRLAHVPVLAAHAGAQGLPERAMAAVDFSSFSLDAARAALELVAERGELHLVHVSWSLEEQEGEEPEWVKTYEAGARERLEELTRSLEPGRRVRVLPHVLRGEFAPALLGFAERLQAELVATGSHGYGFLGRILMGSVSTRLIRRARCSVLVSPPRTVPAELRAPRRPEAAAV